MNGHHQRGDERQGGEKKGEGESEKEWGGSVSERCAWVLAVVGTAAVCGGTMLNGRTVAAEEVHHFRKGAALIAEADDLLKRSKLTEAYTLLSEYNDLIPNNTNVRMRLANIARTLAKDASLPSDRRRQLKYSAAEHAAEAAKYDPNDAKAQYLAGVTLWEVCEYEWPSSWCQKMTEVKAHLEKAIELNPYDPLPHHYLGKWHWLIYNTSWVYTQVAGWMFFSAVPAASIDEALRCFLRAEEEKHGSEAAIENRLLIAKVYLALNDKESAKHWLRFVLISKGRSEEDRKAMEEAKGLMQLLG